MLPKVVIRSSTPKSLSLSLSLPPSLPPLVCIYIHMRVYIYVLHASKLCPLNFDAFESPFKSYLDLLQEPLSNNSNNNIILYRFPK